MKVHGSGGQPLPKPAAQNISGRPQFATALAAASSPATTTDFSDMSRRELFDWMNAGIRGGQISLDDSSGLLSLAARGTDDQQRFDFVQLAQDGIETARLRKDNAAQTMLETALAILQRASGSRVDRNG
ncbi:MAG: hypothetical protein V4808_02935 [Pseudomonadota bacterium]